jgi:hypothetical protein
MKNHLDYTGMKAISVWQPWAWLIVHGHKSIETRSWPAPDALIGQRIAIHAAQRKVILPVWKHLALLAMHRGIPLLEIEDTIRGALVGTVELVEVREYPDAESFFKDGHGHLCTNEALFEPTRYGWVFRYPELEDSPIPFKGQQGFFNVHTNMAARAREQGIVPPWPGPPEEAR